MKHRLDLLGLLIFLSLSVLSITDVWAQKNSRGSARTLTLDEALELARKNNRDLLAARERLNGARADVERALAQLLPRLSAQGRFTVNHPEVELPLDQRSGVFGALLLSSTGLPPGPLRDYCMSPEARNPQVCPQPIQGELTVQRIDRLLDDAVVRFPIVPRTQLDATITATLPLIAPPAYVALSSAQQAYRAQQKQLQATEAQLLQSVASAFFAAAGADEVVLARTHAIEVAEQTLKNARARLEAGVVNRVEVTRAELALIQARQRLLEAEDGRGAAYRVLATLILLREPFRVVPPQEPAIENASDADLVAEALARRPELPALEYSARAAEVQALAAGLRWLPMVSAFGNIRLTNATAFAGRVDTYAAGLQLDWQLFDGLERDAQRRASAAQAREARLRLRQLRDTIADEVLNARQQVLTRREGLRSAQRSVQLAKETLELVRIQHDAGTATQLDLLTAQDQLVLAEVGVAQARFDLSLANLSLQRLLGRPLGRTE
ncbi:MAG: TolC family protein [Myxococcales bacterium]|nr:TolC family protein [Myxococcota bacterium]MDW8282479.1 TolC family protein [Myxococcales bacterium]